MVKTDKEILMFRIQLLLQCNKRTAASDRRTVRDENQAMESIKRKQQTDSSRVRRERGAVAAGERM